MTSRTLRKFASATGTFALITAGVAAVSSPASAAPNPSAIGAPCPDVFPADELTKFQDVTGLTTAGVYKDSLGGQHDSSVTPEQFTGHYLDTQQDDSGDLLLFEFEGSRITHTDGKVDAGIWSGMSGSPVYATDGRLIGAVSYTFGSDGASQIAGVTPAADMYAMLDAQPTQVNSMPNSVKLSKAQAATVRKAGVQASSGDRLNRIAPVQVITAGGPKVRSAAVAAIARKAGQPVPRIATGGSTQSTQIDIVPGGNLAASDSYGSVASYGVGTATAICGDQVLAFGHPANFAPPSKAIHGASTTVIQDSGAMSYKLANLGAPSGVLVKDQLNGILGKLGLVPTYPKVSSNTNGLQSVSTVPNPDALVMVAALQAYRDAVVSLKQDAGGEALMSWTIKYTRENGAKQSFTRSQRFSSVNAIGTEVINDLASDIVTISDNEFENVTIDDVSFNTSANPTYKAYKVGTVEYRYKGKWIKRKHSGTSNIRAQAGKKLVLRVNYVKADKKSKVTPTARTYSWNVPKSARGTNLISIEGNAPSGDEFDDEEDFDDMAFSCDDDGECTFTESAGPASFNALIKEMKSQPRSDDVTADFALTKATYHRKSRLPAIVKGSFDLKVKVYK